jgi:hypothetical protein
MSKQRQVKARKRKTGYINLVKRSEFTKKFYSFAAFAAWANNR